MREGTRGAFTGLKSLVLWRDFDAEAFRTAQAGDRLLFMVVAAPLNNSYVPVLVDAEERLDIAERYLSAGMPTLALVHASGEVLWAGAPLEPEALLALLAKVQAYCVQNRRELLERVRAAREEQVRAQVPNEEAQRKKLTSGLMAAQVRQALAAFDPEHHGFCTEFGFGGPKYPHLETIDLLLLAGPEVDPVRARATVKTALEALLTRGLWDQSEGGLQQCARERDWSQVVRVKRLEDNAMLLRTLCTAAAIYSDAALRDRARAVLQALPAIFPGEGSAFAASRYAPAAADGAAAWAVDGAVATDANAVMASALLTASWALDEPAAQARGAGLVDFLWDHYVTPDHRVAHRWWVGQAGTFGLLGDVVPLGLALLDAFEVTGEPRYSDRAQALFDEAVKRFKQSGGGFWDIEQQAQAPGRLKYRRRLLSLNSLMAEWAARLALLNRNQWYRDCALEALAEFAGTRAQHGLAASRLAAVGQRLLTDPPVFVVTGERMHPTVQQLHAAALRVPVPGRVAQILDPIRDLELLKRFDLPQKRTPRLFVCCKEQTDGPFETVDAVQTLAQTAA